MTRSDFTVANRWLKQYGYRKTEPWRICPDREWAFVYVQHRTSGEYSAITAASATGLVIMEVLKATSSHQIKAPIPKRKL